MPRPREKDDKGRRQRFNVVVGSNDHELCTGVTRKLRKLAAHLALQDQATPHISMIRALDWALDVALERF